MFIISKRAFKFRFPDGSCFRVDRDFMGEVPEYVAEHPLFKLAVEGGEIMTPTTHRDKAIHDADDAAAEAARRHDIRPDAAKPEEVPAEDAKPVKRANKRPKTKA